jgi:hypothetical protein
MAVSFLGIPAEEESACCGPFRITVTPLAGWDDAQMALSDNDRNINLAVDLK